MTVERLIWLLNLVQDKTKTVTFADGAEIILVAVLENTVVLTDEAE